VAVPEVLAVHHLPQVLDPRRVFADDELRQVFDRPDDGPGVPFQGRLAPPEEAVLVGEHLDEHPVPHPGVADVRFDAGDLHGWANGVGEGRAILPAAAARCKRRIPLSRK